MTSNFLLVDAMNMIYRSFYAVSNLTTSGGHPTNAVYGFVKALGHLDQVWRPTHLMVVFDGGVPAERIELLPDYKAQRPPMPSELKEQLPDIQEYLDCAQITSLRVEGEEADDVIASAALNAEQAGINVLIASGDKDFMQIVNEKITLVLPGKSNVKTGVQEVLEKTGVMPEQIVEWLALTGDNADNIPGVPGVGPKTATKWLREWGSINSMLANANEVKPEKLRARLVENHAVVERNILMMRLRKNITCFNSPDDAKRRSPDIERLLRFYKKMEFHSFVNKLREQELL